MIKKEVGYKTGKIVIDDFSKVNLRNKKIQSKVEGVKLYNFNNAKGVLEKSMGIKTLNLGLNFFIA